MVKWEFSASFRCSHCVCNELGIAKDKCVGKGPCKCSCSCLCLIKQVQERQPAEREKDLKIVFVLDGGGLALVGPLIS